MRHLPFDLVFLFFVSACASVRTDDGAYIPSGFSRKVATVKRTDYDFTKYVKTPDKQRQKILMLCTEERYMTMQNGKKFSTGNHPVEMLVPMLHLEEAGFEIDILTPTGKSAKIEMWAMPEKDEAVRSMYEKYKSQFEQPGSMADFVSRLPEAGEGYTAIFIPGGHGTMLGLPENPDMGKIIRWAHEQERYTLAICHGPAALLAAQPEGQAAEAFLYEGYKMAVFPDALDKKTPSIGYLPGDLPWYFGEKLEALGVTIINKKAKGTFHRDRRLITGDSPKAANAFGKLAATTLLEGVGD